ncbi:malate dehydrogenase, glyoxysomal-like [Platysternon megacephalum]|uniref:Malate dehydrogenase, glyoxysomal-like n=1 Tax=Platysternon megacephalum TaxID=55544 RepID=A0A4D9DEP4_9SAUR|nr:malate dehydrogenase, glyoxysomal-like [Platysternon megacephalum]
MGSPHEYQDAEVAAEAYARQLGETVFDLCLLGVGPDGHVASVFPDHESFAPSTESVIAVVDSPKPPPVRVSLTVERLMTSREIWFLISGEDKAAALKELVAGTPTIPAGLVRGSQETIVWCDQDAASSVDLGA